MGLKIYQESPDREINDFFHGGKIERAIRLIRLIESSIKIENYTLEIVEWFKPFYYIELRQDYFKYPNNTRLSLSYNTETGTIMDETLNGIKSEKFHGCIRKGMGGLLSRIKKELNTDFYIPIDTRRKNV